MRLCLYTVNALAAMLLIIVFTCVPIPRLRQLPVASTPRRRLLTMGTVLCIQTGLCIAGTLPERHVVRVRPIAQL